MKLEERLKEIIKDDYSHENKSPEDLRAEIIQAFKDEGFQKYMEEWPRITGQEWYDKFKEQLKPLISRGDGETWMGWDCGEVHTAAKKAAGL